MPNVTIEVRLPCPTCDGRWTIGALDCRTCRGAGTVVDAERSQWLRAVAERMADAYAWVDGDWCLACHTLTSNHAPDCPHELAQKVMAWAG